MPGFSRREQKMLSFLVLNHRRKPRQPETASYRFKPDWTLVVVLRLACLFNRVRLEQRLPPMRLPSPAPARCRAGGGRLSLLPTPPYGPRASA